MKICFLVLSVAALCVFATVAHADCTGCVGDYAVTESATDIWGDPASPDKTTHEHDFGALCDATNLGGHTGEVYITIRVVADLDGTDRYVTANFVSGGNSTAITSGNDFINAPSDGKFFKTGGATGCDGSKNEATVQLDYDDFNSLLDAGDGTLKIEVVASAAVEDLCDLCCESGHSWTPDGCCNGLPPCACPPSVESSSEVVLIYLDCDVIGEPFECVINADCNDNLHCTGTETCDDGLCVATGNPCLATGKICNESTDACDNCASDAECQAEQSLYCDGVETCSSGTCQTGTNPCTGGQQCDEVADVCFTPPTFTSCLP